MPPHTPQFDGDDGGDENGHYVCPSCEHQAYGVVDTTQDWSSSEDGDLWRINCGVEGLRLGRQHYAVVMLVARRLIEWHQQRDEALRQHGPGTLDGLLGDLSVAVDAANSLSTPGEPGRTDAG